MPGTPSARGSAEVIARGTNPILKQWWRGSIDPNETSGETRLNLIDTNYGYTTPSLTEEFGWDQWYRFPTVVRVGNFVFCVVSFNSASVAYNLIDIVDDPTDPGRLGGDRAYPYLLNPKVSNIDNVHVDADAENNITIDGPVFALEFQNERIFSFESDASNVYSYGGGFLNTIYSNFNYPEYAILSLDNNGKISGAQFSNGDSGVNRRQPIEIRGWGGRYRLRTSNGYIPTREDDPGNSNSYQHVFAPVYSYGQFLQLYGNEDNWVAPPPSVASDPNNFSERYNWLFPGNKLEPYNNPNKNVFGVQFRSGQLPSGSDYIFSFEEAQWNPVLKHVDTDVVEEFPDFAGDETPAAMDSAITPQAIAIASLLSVGKCKFDPFTKSIEDGLADIKNLIAGATDSTGLSELMEKAKGFRDTLVANLPQIPEIFNMAEVLSKLDVFNLEAVQIFKDKYGALVDNIDAIIDQLKLPGFDICSLFNVEGTVDENGNVKKVDSGIRPNNPNKEPEEPPRNTEVPEIGASQPISNDIGLTKENSEAALKYIASQWELVIEPFGTDKEQRTIAQSVIASARKRLLEFYQVFQGEKEITSKQLNDSIRRDYIDRRLKRRVGRIYRGDVAVGFDVYEEEDLKRDTEMIEDILSQIDEYIFTDEMIQNYRVLSIADPKDYTRTADTPQEPEADGDIVSEPTSPVRSIGQRPSVSEPTPTVRGTKGSVTDDFKNAIRNKPIQGALRSILEQVSAETETSIVIYSAGQDKKGTPNARRTGSIRHDNGYAADIRIYKDGRRLTALRSSDHEDLTEIVKSLKKAGIGSVGAGPGYMNGNLHVDIADRVGQGRALTWGAGGRSANTPSWLRTAFYG